MATLFEDSKWIPAIRKLDHSRVMGIRAKASRIMEKLPQRFNDDDLKRIGDELNEIRRELAYARENSDISDFWPTASCSDEELLLWLTALNRYTILPPTRRR